MIKLEASKMTKAIERAKAVRPTVKVINADERTYSVTGSKGDTAYTVRFAVANGHKLAECNCKAGQAGMMCFHVAAAAAVNIGVQSMRRQAVAVPQAKKIETPRVVRKIESDRNGVKIVATYCNDWAV